MFRFLFVASLALCAAAPPTIFKYKPQLVPMFSNGRIVGGDDTTIEQYPWQISLQRYGSHICGGSVLTTTRVVTAAHCTDGASASSLTIRAGSTIKGSGGQVVQVSSIAQHESYDSWTMDNDISVLRFNSPLTLGEKIQTIELPNQGYIVPASILAEVTGWDSTSQSGSLPSVLQVVDIPIILNAACKLAYVGSLISDGMLCAGYPAGGRDACQGDSGGPLVVNRVLQGIVSWGNGCAQAVYPGVYTRVAYYRNWINNVD